MKNTKNTLHTKGKRNDGERIPPINGCKTATYNGETNANTHETQRVSRDSVQSTNQILHAFLNEFEFRVLQFYIEINWGNSF